MKADLIETIMKLILIAVAFWVLTACTAEVQVSAQSSPPPSLDYEYASPIQALGSGKKLFTIRHKPTGAEFVVIDAYQSTAMQPLPPKKIETP